METKAENAEDKGAGTSAEQVAAENAAAQTAQNADEGASQAAAAENPNSDSKPGAEGADENAGDNPGEGKGEGDGEGEQPIEWHQKRAASPTEQSAAETASEEGGEGKPNPEVVALQEQIQQKDKRIEELEKQVADYKNLDEIKSDAMVQAWLAHKAALGDKADPTTFLKEVGQINEVSALTEQEKVHLFYTNEAKELGFKDEEFDRVVGEKMFAYEQMLELDKRKVVLQAEKALSGKKATSVEEIKAKYLEQIQKEQKAYYDEMLKVQNWAKNQFQMANEYVMDKILSKGKFNGRNVDSQWGKKILSYIENSPLFTDPNFLPLAEPDENGVQNIYIPELIEKVDAMLFHKEIIESLTKKAQNARVENLEERARNAEQKKIDEEKSGLSAKELEDKRYQDALAAEKKRKSGAAV